MFSITHKMHDSGNHQMHAWAEICVCVVIWALKTPVRKSAHWCASLFSLTNSHKWLCTACLSRHLYRAPGHPSHPWMPQRGTVTILCMRPRSWCHCTSFTQSFGSCQSSCYHNPSSKSMFLHNGERHISTDALEYGFAFKTSSNYQGTVLWTVTMFE